MNVLSLFSGIGGLELGLERAGMTVVGQVEIDEFCRSVLAKHWPGVPRHDDVRTAPEWWAGEPRPAVDVVAGGFPCQPFSTASTSARRLGVADERWGWPWMWDVIRAVRPQFVLVENVAALLRDRRAFGWLLGDLAEGGFDAEWDCIPAAAVGAPHRRDRLFLAAYTNSEAGRFPGPTLGGDGSRAVCAGQEEPRRRGATLANPKGESGLPLQGLATGPWPTPEFGKRGGGPGPGDGWWAVEPPMGRVVNGAPARVVRAQLKALGNAVVPQVAEHIGRLITGVAT